MVGCDGCFENSSVVESVDVRGGKAFGVGQSGRCLEGVHR